jgi:hypothetical protein
MSKITGMPDEIKANVMKNVDMSEFVVDNSLQIKICA